MGRSRDIKYVRVANVSKMASYTLYCSKTSLRGLWGEGFTLQRAEAKKLERPEKMKHALFYGNRVPAYVYTLAGLTARAHHHQACDSQARSRPAC